MGYELGPMEIEQERAYEKMGLSEAEYSQIKDLLGRQPNYTETGIYSVMWSEHCSYKTSRPLLKKFPTKAPQVLVGPGEGAGVVDIGDGQAVVFKMESHNSPSRINPYEGAATGVGGILRDVFSMGARPIAAMNSLRFSPLQDERTKYLFKEVVRGIADYGNEVGVPTVGGEIQFDDSYDDRPLVNAMVVGLIDHDKIQKGLANGPGNTVIYAGRATGRDGIHGATHSSDDQDAADASPATGNPELERRLIEACLEVVNHDALVGMQDMGAAGLTSSGSEMAEKAGTGMVLNLDLVPQAEEDMSAYEMMLSETQERMLLVVEKGREEEILSIFAKHDIDAASVGEVLEEEVFRVEHAGKVWAEIPTATLEAPVHHLPSEEAQYFQKEQAVGRVKLEVEGFGETLQALLQQPTIASKEWVYNQFDSKARNQTLAGPGAGAAVVKIDGHEKAIAISTDCNSRYIYLDPENGGKIAVAEALRNIVVSGATPVGITDGLNYGNPTNPEVFWQMEKSIDGISEACRELNVPVISGNVSMYNQSHGNAIFPTPIIGVVGLIEDLSYITPNTFQDADDLVYVIGEPETDFGGSELQYMLKGKYEGHAPKIDLAVEKRRQEKLTAAIKAGLVQSAEDLSEGGLGVALAGSVMRTSGLGARIALTDEATIALFSETQSRYLVSIKPAQADAFEALCQDAIKIGTVMNKEALIVQAMDGKEIIHEDVNQLRGLWSGRLEELLKSK